ncbi:GntR family transcriptional regulator [Jannaschia sp. 2305UL9-9]|uniref:GntR family transcriptional regulator n=1 Tax=Jannaschia sp. 2305UL9-9 TaxID=3121638 RepID=UPI0035273958
MAEKQTHPIRPPQGNTSDTPSTLSETAYVALSQMIQERSLPVGRPIVETQLADMLGVSRTPLRQALQRLEAEGLLRKSESRSYVVRRVELREYLQSLKVREVLEAEAAEMAIGRIAPEAISRARAHVQAVQGRKPYDMLAHWASDDEIHDLFIDACGNQVIINILKSLRVTTKLFEIERLSERLEPDSSQHESILDALYSGNAVATRQAVVDHLRSLADFAVRVL